MAEMQASFLSQQHEPLMRRSPRRKSLSPSSHVPGPSTPLAPPPMDMQQLTCSRGGVGPAVRTQASPACSPASYKSNKSSWLSLPGVQGSGLGSRAPKGVLFGTGIVLILSGIVANVLSFYMLSLVSQEVRAALAAPRVQVSADLTLTGYRLCLLQKGRQYYLDFGVLSAFASLMLGIVGLRSRVGHLLPNRNYVTGE